MKQMLEQANQQEDEERKDFLKLIDDLLISYRKAQKLNAIGLMSGEDLLRIEGLYMKHFEYRKRCDEVLLSRRNSEEGLVFSGEMSDEEVLCLLELCQEPSFTIPSGLSREERMEWALSKIKENKG